MELRPSTCLQHENKLFGKRTEIYKSSHQKSKKEKMAIHEGID